MAAAARPKGRLPDVDNMAAARPKGRLPDVDNMPPIPDHQGDLKPLESLSKLELQDLLTRQEKILGNKRFVKSLKDGGQKIQSFADRLKEAIKELEDVETTAQLLERLQLGSSSTEGAMIEGAVIERIPDISAFSKEQNQTDRLKTSTTTTKQSQNVPNVFLKTDTATPTAKKTPKFFAHRSLKSTSIPEGLTKPNAPPPPERKASASGEPRPPEESAVALRPLRHPGTKAIDLEESRELLETQKKRVDGLLAQHAAEKLAERLHIRIGEYTPSQIDMRYRDEEDEEDSDDDEDDDDVDDKDGDVDDVGLID